MNLHKGFIVPLVLVIIAAIVVGVGYLSYEKGKSSHVSQGDVLSSNTASTTSSTLPVSASKPPPGYMIPDMTKIPAGYSLSLQGFTDHSALYDFKGPNNNIETELSFIETTESYFSQSLGTVMSFPGAKAIKGFTYQNNQGAVVGDFETNLYKGSPSSPTESQPYDEYYLLYDHNGRLVEIHTYDVSTLTPDKLIQLLEEMKISL